MALSNESNAIIEMLRARQNQAAESLQADAKGSDYAASKADAAQPVQAQNSGTTMYVNVKRLNVRRGSGKNYPLMGSLSSGKPVKVLETAANGWCKISFMSGEGWVCGKFLTDKAGSAQKQGGQAAAAHKPAGSADNSAAKGASGLAADAVKFAESMIGSRKYVETRKKKDGSTYKMTKCQRFVADAASKAIGFLATRETAAIAANAWEISNDMSNIPVGAAVYFYSSTPNGKKCGHVGIHVGNNQIVHVAGAVKKQSLSQINSNGVHTFRSWGWNGGVKLKQPDEQQ